MKQLFNILLLVALSSLNTEGQIARPDSLIRLLENTPRDSNRVKLLLKTAQAFFFSKPDSCLIYSTEAIDLAKKLRMNVAEITALHTTGEALRFIGDYPASLKTQFEALKLSREIKDREREGGSLGYIGFTYTEIEESRVALQYLFASLYINQETGNKIKFTFDLTNIGEAYDQLNMADSALYYQLKAIASYQGLTHGPLKSLLLTRLANAYVHSGRPDSAFTFYYQALANCLLVNDKVNVCKVQGRLAVLHAQQKNYDSSIYYARLSHVNGKISMQRLVVMESSELLTTLYRRRNQPDSALIYQDFAISMKDSLYGAAKYRQLQLLMLGEQQRKQQAEQDQQAYKNRVKYIILSAVLGAFLLTSFLLYRNNRLQKKAKSKVEAAYRDLKDTQLQLVQREKMASLGELTAGIAHEIQNPLNFVNNFSELSAELVKEMNEEYAKGNLEDASAIAGDLTQNLEKISHHGKRAADIVKSMLQHSRNNSSTKEPADLNILADEYLRLAYHGLRAKDKTFQATMKTDYDKHIGKINIIPQDIGRAILNLITNAFYAVAEKAKQEPGGYEPAITVSTKKENFSILLSVKDNGNGIPLKAVDKIFQPFFTTKPSGQGTGLGLSLSYDIVKAHGGELLVETSEGNGSTFTIKLPADRS